MISTHAPRTGSDIKPPTERGNDYISTHAPRTGSDFPTHHQSILPLYFNPRSPHGERHVRQPETPAQLDFNPRSPHGERPKRIVCCRLTAYFNPRSPHGERRESESPARNTAEISTHAPRTGSDLAIRSWESRLTFQPTLPARGATDGLATTISVQEYFNPRSPHGERLQKAPLPTVENISTHAPRTGSDQIMPCLTIDCHISTHAPRTGSDLKG